MKTKISAYLIAMSCISIFMTSCSTSTQVASSFGKRKYMKGYYVNLPSPNQAMVASNQAPILPTKSEAIKTQSPGMLNVVLASLAKGRLQAATSIARKLRGNNEKKIVPAATISTKGNTNLVVKTIKQTEQVSTPPNLSGTTEYHHGESAGGSGNQYLDWAALVGFVCAFLLPPLGLIFCIIGLKSTYQGLAVAGIIVASVIIFFAVAITIITLAVP
jgi:hypothetical protein